ncbi:MAG: hypothetical protein HRT88_01015 [Lentisphaeraceae bacterium]|nr:hypothetical protein [Lentisphaeraceae bacterium]
MKKFFAILFIATLALTACKKEETTTEKLQGAADAVSADANAAAADATKKVEVPTK